MHTNTEITKHFLKEWKRRGNNTIAEVRVLKAGGPFTTKGEATLWKCLELTPKEFQDDFLQFNHPANLDAEVDIRGFREYIVLDQKAGKVGGDEFHLQRQEIVFCTNGKVEWICEDLYGRKVSYILEPGCGLWIPPFVLHTFKAIRPTNDLAVICNTTYTQEDTRTHDTFKKEVFQLLQSEIVEHVVN